MERGTAIRGRREALAWAGLALRLVVGGVALVAGLSKVGDPEGSVRAVLAYDLVHGSLADIVGFGLPAFEIVLGAVLVAGLLTRWAALVNALLMMAFIAAVASAWARGLSIDCGCFGGGGVVDPGATDYPGVLARDAGLLLASAYLVVRPDSRLSADRALDL